MKSETCGVYYKGRNFHGQNYPRFLRISGIFAKVYYLKETNLQIRKSFFSQSSNNEAIRESLF